MELQNYIQNKDYFQEFKNLKLNVRKYSKLGLMIVKTYKNNNYDYEKYPWMRYCRGAIINTKNNRVVCVPPMKSEEKIEIDEIINDYNTDLNYSPLIDGTMINMFFHNDEWVISTRSNIGGKNSWDGKVPFNQLFSEVNGTEWFSELDPNCCYSFVLNHLKNRIITPVMGNKIIMVEKYKLGKNIERCYDFENIKNIENISSFDLDGLKTYSFNIPYYIKGFTIKSNDMRYKWINPAYTYVESLKMNNNNKFLSYMELRKKWLLNEYLSYFPEERLLFNDYKNRITFVKDELFKSYINYRVKRNIDIMSIEYSLRPHINNLHDYYKKNNVRITRKIVSNYVNNLDGKQLIFIINRIFDSKV